MIRNRELLIAKLAEHDTQEATPQDLEACYYRSAHDFYDQLSDPALERLAESINLQEEHDHD